MTIYDTHRKGIEKFEGLMPKVGFEFCQGHLNDGTSFITSQEISLLEAVVEMALGLLLENEKVEEEYGNRDETAYNSAIADLIVDLEDAIDQIKNDTAV